MQLNYSGCPYKGTLFIFEKNVKFSLARRRCYRALKMIRGDVTTGLRGTESCPRQS